jgi:DDE family transposase
MGLASNPIFKPGGTFRVNDTTVIGKAGNFNIAFRATKLTSHAGAVLFKDFFARLEVAQTYDAEVSVKQRGRGYSESRFILAACASLILGGQCVDDLKVLRGDPGTKALLEFDEVPSPQALGAFIKRFRIGDIHDLLRAQRLIQERVHRLIVEHLPEPVCTLDFDASIFAQFAKLREGVRKAYNGERGYAPLLVYWAEVGELLYAHFQRGNAYPSKKAIWVLDKALRLIPPGLGLRVRGDSAFYARAFLGECERRGILYAITADQTKALRAAIEALRATAWTQDPEDAELSYAEFRYAPSRQGERRYCVKRALRRQADGTTKTSYHVVVTNDLERSAREIVQWQLGRCAMENLIKEFKHGFSLEKFPSRKYHANWAYFLIGQLAFNLVAWFKYLILPEEFLRATIKTLRHRLFNLAGKIVSKSRQFFLVITDEYQFQDVWASVLKSLSALRLGAYQ